MTPVDLQSKLNSYGIPEHMHNGVELYLLKRIQPGSFLVALFSNDFLEAAGRADHMNQTALFQWACFMMNCMPMGSYGSEERVRAWLKGEGDV